MTSMMLGWIGTGVMGNSMCGHLMNAGHQLFIYNRTKSRADNLIDKGAVWCDTPKGVAQHSSVVFSMVGFPADVESTLLGNEGVLAGVRAGSLIVDITTSSPEVAERVFKAARIKSVGAIDAPVSGGDIGAREGTLAIMAGGDENDFNQVRPLLEIMGGNIAYMGPGGAGQHTKMCNQILLAGTMIGMVESLLYAHRVGMDMDAVIDVIGKGAAQSWMINNLGRRIAKSDFAPGFYIKHFVKDMGIALAEARRMNLCLPGLALVQQFYIAAQAMGYEELGIQGLYRLLETLNNIKS